MDPKPLNPIQLLELIKATLDAAFAASVNAEMAGTGEAPSLPYEITTRAAAQRYVERSVRAVLTQDFGARW